MIKPTLGHQKTQCLSSSAVYVEKTLYFLSSQTRVSHLTLIHVVAEGLSYYAKLIRYEKGQFQLTKVFLLNTASHIEPALYDFDTQLLEIPNVFAFGKHYRVTMQNDGANHFSIVTATEK